jgi:hypothetical protein
MNLVPVKTPLALAELSSRQRKLTQRHRTVLLLVDGVRSEEQIRQLALQAGCLPACFDDLLGLGMLTYAEPAPTVIARDSTHSILPASLTLQPSVNDSFLSELPSQNMTATEPAGSTPPTQVQDEGLEEARLILIRAVRAEAPVAGALTLLRLRRATNRAELEALLEEAELRITKPFKGLWATQTMLRVKELLMYHQSKA